jgi:hypothetical protein
MPPVVMPTTVIIFESTQKRYFHNPGNGQAGECLGWHSWLLDQISAISPIPSMRRSVVTRLKLRRESSCTASDPSAAAATEYSLDRDPLRNWRWEGSFIDNQDGTFHDLSCDPLRFLMFLP